MNASFSSFLRAEEKDRSFGSFQKEHLSDKKEKMIKIWKVILSKNHLGIAWLEKGCLLLH